MPKKKSQPQHSAALEAPDYDQYTSLDVVDEAIQQHKDTLVRKDKTEFQIKESKKESNAAHNEQLKELLEERQHELAVIDALQDRRRVLLAQTGVVPLPKPATH